MKSKLTFVFAVSALAAMVLAAGSWAAGGAKPAKAKMWRVAGTVAVKPEANATTIEVKDKEGKATTYTLATGATVMRGKEKAQLTDLAEGTRVMLRGTDAADGQKSVAQIHIMPEKAKANGAAKPKK